MTLNAKRPCARQRSRAQRKGTSESSVAPERSPCRITSTIRFRMLLRPCAFRPHGDDDADKGASSSPQISASGNNLIG